MALLSKVIFFIVFVLVVLPVGLVQRALGVDQLKKRPDRTAKSYWNKA